MKALKYTNLTLALIIFASAFATAQTVPSPSPAPATPIQTKSNKTDNSDIAITKSSGTDVELSGIDVNGVSYDQTTLPTRPTTSFNGIQATVQDTPRSVSQITPEQLKTRDLTNSQDLARFAPGATANFTNGTASAPYIRGQQADIYFNGIREDRGGTLVPFSSNALDGVDIVTGPASAIFGPSASTSGYINYISKQAFFDANHTSIDLYFGDFHIGGQSNPDFIQTIDNGGPIIKDKLAYRASVQVREGNSFYGDHGLNGDPQQHINFYGDLNWIPNKDITIDTNFQVNNFDYASTRGWNRVTQNLISGGQYLSGPATPILFEAGAKGGYFAPVYTGQTAANPTGFSPTYVKVNLNGPGRTATVTNTAYTGTKPTATAAGAAAVVGYIYDPRLTHLTSIRQNVGYDMADQDAIQQYIAQNQSTFNLDDDFQVANNLYFENTHAQTRQLYESGDAIDDDYVLNDRTEFRLQKSFKLFGANVDYQSNSGIDQRYAQTKTYSLTLSGTDAADITNPSTDTDQGIYGVNVFADNPSRGFINSAYGPIHRINDNVASPTSTASFAIPDYPGYQTAANASEFDFIRQVGVYNQQQFTFNDKWTFQLGSRLTVLAAEATNPIVGLPQKSDSETSLIPSVNSSLIYKPIPSVTTYLTYDYTQAMNANDNPTLSGGQLGSAQFHSESQLGEGGIKWEAIPNKLFTSVAGYWQQRQLAPVATTTGFISPTIQVRGVESALNYQPDKHWDVNANWTWIESNYVNYTITSNKSPGPNLDQGVENADGSVTGYVSQDQGYPALQQSPRGNYRESLIPKNVFNLSTSYTFDEGFGARTDFWVHDSWTYFLNSNVVIPAEYNLDLTLFYAPPKQNWRASVTVTNLTNQLNFQPNGMENVNDFIDPLPPLGIQGRFTYNF